METIKSEKLDSKFKDEVAACPGGENIRLCFACGACTATCPVAGVCADFNPRRIIRQVLLGQREEVLQSPLLWQCMQCYACTVKCPQNVKFRDIAKALRALAVKYGYATEELSAERENWNQLILQVQRDGVTWLTSDRARYQDLKKQLESGLINDKKE